MNSQWQRVLAGAIVGDATGISAVVHLHQRCLIGACGGAALLLSSI